MILIDDDTLDDWAGRLESTGSPTEDSVAAEEVARSIREFLLAETGTMWPNGDPA